MKKIAIYGAGGFGRETTLLIQDINKQNRTWDVIGYFDDTRKSTDNVLGGMNELNQYPDKLSVVVAIADTTVREEVVKRINNPNVSFPVLIHPTALVNENEVKIGEGSIICAKSVFTTSIELGKHIIINLACTIGHDVRINDYGAVMPGVHISGAVTIGKGTLLGTGSRTLQNLTIGEKCKVGAGAVVIGDVPNNTTVVGVPAKPVKPC